MKVADFQSIKIKIASPEEILSWSHGEVKKAETINYRSQLPERDGLFCERIFGPTKDYECYCGKYKGIRYKEMVCDRCGVEITKSQVRRERMGHIKLAVPVSHIWFLKSVPSRLGLLLNVSQQKLERVVYFVDYIIEKTNEELQKNLLKELQEEFKKKKKEISQLENLEERKKQEKELKENFLKTKEEITNLRSFQIFSEIEYRKYSLKYGEIFTAGTGAETIRRILEKMDLKKEIKKIEEELKRTSSEIEKRKILQRLRLFQNLKKNNIRPEWMILAVLPVLAPELRPMVQLEGGRYASADLNEHYRRVINRNNRLKYLLEISAPEAIIRNEKRMLQESVDSLLDNSMRDTQITTPSTGGKRLLKSLADVLSGKQGRFRKNLLGKRVDYSGRSVIAPGPELKLHQCGLPKIMAVELFRPFIIKVLLDKGIASHIKTASRLIDEKTDEVFKALEEIVKDKLVLLNRAPTLHRLGIQAFEPVLIEGEAIKIHPLVCHAFNADFDGDQMAVHIPLSQEAQGEAKNLMLSNKNLLKCANGLPIISPTLDITFGCYWLTKEEEIPVNEKEIKVFSGPEEAIMSCYLNKIKIHSWVKIPLLNKKPAKLILTTVGRIIFNNILPLGFPFINERINSKRLSEIIAEIIEKYPEETTRETLDKIKDLGFEYATFSGLTLGIEDFVIPKEKEKILEEKEKEFLNIEKEYQKGFLSQEEKKSKTIELWHEAKELIEKHLIKDLPKSGPVFTIIDSGTKGSWTQPIQICGMKGLVTSPTGRIIELPIKNSLKEGFDILEFFISSHGARKGVVDTALRTSRSGHLTRRLAEVAHEVIVVKEDCKDKEGREVIREDAEEINQDFIFKIVGQFALEDIKNPKTNALIVKKDEIITWKKAKEISDNSEIKKVKIRSVLSCKLWRGVCQKCYGWDLGKNQLIKLGEAVGIIAAQSIGEPGTQLTLRTRHIGGVAGGGDITYGLPRVEEILELKGLKEEGIISLTDGIVKKIDFEKREIIISPKKTNKKEIEEIKYSFSPNMGIYIKKGDKIAVGQILTSGPLDLRKLFKISDRTKTERYIIKEIQKIYVSEGIKIHDKHLEVIVRQMFSRIRIVEPGDSLWAPGQVVSRAIFEETQALLKKEGKKLAVGQSFLLGISRVTLSSDSFLSAAAFQETRRVLIEAALQASKDNLYGLQENVIIGRLLPIGAGFRK